VGGLGSKDQESSFCPEFNDSHDFDISLHQTDRNEGDRPKKVERNLSPTSELNLQPSKAYDRVRDQVREQLEMLIGESEESEEKTARLEKKKKEHKKRLEQKV